MGVRAILGGERDEPVHVGGGHDLELRHRRQHRGQWPVDLWPRRRGPPGFGVGRGPKPAQEDRAQTDTLIRIENTTWGGCERGVHATLAAGVPGAALRLDLTRREVAVDGAGAVLAALAADGWEARDP